MLTVRRLMIAFGPLTVVALGACLVFDGLEATDDGGEADAAQDRTVRNDRLAEDVAPDQGRGGDTAIGDVQTVEDAPGSDAPGSDTSMPPSDAGIGNRVICGNRTCPGGKDQKCCAHVNKGSASWTYASMPRCGSDCAEAGPGGGYYDYECDDDDQCKGMLCCAHGSSPPPYAQSMCKPSCSGTDRELCQPDHGCSKDAACVPADAYYVPPGYFWCD